MADTFAYCLMPNHVHFVIRMKSHDKLAEYFTAQKKEIKEGTLHKMLSHQFSNVFNSYSKSYNKLYKRRGSLFIPTFKRKLIQDKSYLRTIILYVHNNPPKAGLSPSPAEWHFSSYAALMKDSDGSLLRSEAIEAFGDLENFRYVHEGYSQTRRI